MGERAIAERCEPILEGRRQVAQMRLPASPPLLSRAALPPPACRRPESGAGELAGGVLQWRGGRSGSGGSGWKSTAEPRAAAPALAECWPLWETLAQGHRAPLEIARALEADPATGLFQALAPPRRQRAPPSKNSPLSVPADPCSGRAAACGHAAWTAHLA